MTDQPFTARVAGVRVPPLVWALRPGQWPKNGIVFAALLFSAGRAWSIDDLSGLWPLLWRSGALAGLFCLASSATYLVNDVEDREADRLHPRKARRPVASGAVSVRLALTAAAVLAVIALPLTFLLDPVCGLVVGGYVALMAGYSLGLKRVAVLDVVILCAGVVARAASGAIVIDVTISPWLYVCSSFAAFFLGVSKRWAEYRQLGDDAARHRPSLANYNQEILEQMLTMSGAGAVLSYALYSIESENVPENGAMALTIPFVAFGMFRYLLLLDGRRRTDAPDQILFTDPQVVASVAGFLAVAVIVLLAR